MGKLNMITRLAGVLVLFAASQSFAAGGAALEHANIEPGNIASLQRGARNFMNYCSGCHSAKYVRFSTIGRDLELSDEQLSENLMFNAEKTYETIKVSMPEAAAGRWFGVAPPDLSLIGRAKGADYIYSFLKGFYVQAESPTGVDNTVLAGTSMPHVLWELQGFQRAVFSEHTEDGVTTRHFEGFETLGADVPDLFLDHRRDAEEADLEGREINGNDSEQTIRDDVIFTSNGHTQPPYPFGAGGKKYKHRDRQRDGSGSA
jgi:ubiquinol-cytochrome c reductase cytochrome c1 subunit